MTQDEFNAFRQWYVDRGKKYRWRALEVLIYRVVIALLLGLLIGALALKGYVWV